MSPDERKAWVWQRVEKLLFSPAGEKDQRNWCACYVQSLARYWGIPEFATRVGFPQAGFRLPLMDFSLKYDLAEWNSGQGRASVQMAFEGVDFAAYDIDRKYQSRRSLLKEPVRKPLKLLYPSQGTREDDIARDVRWVLERFILHPCAHVHLVPDIFAYLPAKHELAVLGVEDEPFRKGVHEIRLGFGLTNPFAALFQFRIQLRRDTREEGRHGKKLNAIASRSWCVRQFSRPTTRTRFRRGRFSRWKGDAVPSTLSGSEGMHELQ